jgi:hypothetical protein
MEMEHQAAVGQKCTKYFCKELTKLGNMLATEKEKLDGENAAYTIFVRESRIVTWMRRTAQTSSRSAASRRTRAMSCLTFSNCGRLAPQAPQ